MPMRMLLAIGVGLAVSAAQGGSPQQIQSAYIAQGASDFSSERGAKLWLREGVEGRNCATCHGGNPSEPGQHARTRKLIDPMALSASTGRFANLAKVEKWFKRNCKWTWGRECSAQEKSDLLEYLYRL